MKTIAIILAGGFGQRFGSKVPKQYTSYILNKTIKKFLASELIDQVQVVIREEDNDLYLNQIDGLTLLPVTFGGKTRGESAKKGVEAIAKYNPDLVLIHDANRPFVSVKLINQIIQKLVENDNKSVIPCLPISDTIKKLSKSGSELVNRDNLVSIQTPQGFHFKQLFEICTKSEHLFTDESSLMEANNVTTIYIPGERENIKITYKDDIIMNSEIRSGIGFDAHKFLQEISKHNSIVLGGINIPYERKIEAHSDGDVLIHSLVDALLGSIGEGDIGMAFPPSDPKWKNADSKIFLIHANNLLKQKNGTINNIDLTIICEEPKLGNYRNSIRKNIANILEIAEEKVNIKATTTEKMGFTGRKEGIAVQSIVTIKI